MTFDELIPDNFYNSETRCEYFISSKMKKVWSIQLRLLDSFIRVCDKNNLRYWMFAGALLGAMRHKGYIPWDDDIDVAMPRKDYETLCSHPEWFDGDIQLHMPNNREKYYEGWARIHYVKSAVLYPNYEKYGSKQGIYIDIFPLDYSKNNDKKNRNKIKTINALGHAISYNANPNFFLKMICFFNKVFHFLKPEKLYKKIVNLSSTESKSDKVMLKVCTVYPFEKNIFNVNDFDETIIVPFEFLKVAVPAGYENILTTAYGNWRSFPPQEKRGLWHNYSFSTDKSYKDFKKK